MSEMNRFWCNKLLCTWHFDTKEFLYQEHTEKPYLRKRVKDLAKLSRLHFTSFQEKNGNKQSSVSRHTCFLRCTCAPLCHSAHALLWVCTCSTWGSVCFGTFLSSFLIIYICTIRDFFIKRELSFLELV